MGGGGFWVGPWLHEPPEPESKDGKRLLMRRLCFGPAESWAWYARNDGRFCRETHVIEGLQAGERTVEFVSREEMRRLLEGEAVLCPELAALFLAEAERLDQQEIL